MLGAEGDGHGVGVGVGGTTGGAAIGAGSVERAMQEGGSQGSSQGVRSESGGAGSTAKGQEEGQGLGAESVGGAQYVARQSVGHSSVPNEESMQKMVEQELKKCRNSLFRTLCTFRILSNEVPQTLRHYHWVKRYSSYASFTDQQIGEMDEERKEILAILRDLTVEYQNAVEKQPTENSQQLPINQGEENKNAQSTKDSKVPINQGQQNENAQPAKDSEVTINQGQQN